MLSYLLVGLYIYVNHDGSQKEVKEKKKKKKRKQDAVAIFSSLATELAFFVIMYNLNITPRWLLFVNVFNRVISLY